MARYGRDFDRTRWEEEEEGGRDRGFRGGGFGGGWGRGEYGGMGSEGYGGGYGGMRSEGGRGFNQWTEFDDEGYSGFGGGGGDYGRDFHSGGGRPGEPGGGYGWRGGQGYGGGYGSGGGMARGGMYGGSYSAGGQGGGRDYMGDRGFGGGSDLGGRSQGFGGGAGGGRQQQGGGDELRRMRAADIMTENPETVTADASLADAARKMRDLNVGIIPVVESEQSRRLRGVITDRDIAIRAVAEGKDANSVRVGDCMTTDVETCNKNDSVQDILRVMEREQVRRVPITDREGRLVGIVAQADVLTDLDSHRSEHRVADALERISEPGGRGRGGRSSQSRGGAQGGGMSAGGRGGMTSSGRGSTENPGGGTGNLGNTGNLGSSGEWGTPGSQGGNENF